MSGSAGGGRLVLDNFPQPNVARALSPNGRAHWATRAEMRRLVQTHVRCAVLREQVLAVARPRVRLSLRYVFPQERPRDPDNWTTGVTKAVIDELVRIGILDADDSKHLDLAPVELHVERGQRRLEIQWEPAPTGQE
jgi:hypothetical protein